MKFCLPPVLLLFCFIGFETGAQSLQIHYDFNNNLKDKSGNANDAIAYDTAFSIDKCGRNAYSASVSGNSGVMGSGNYIRIPEVLDGDTSCTISVWVRFRSFSTNQYEESFISFGSLPGGGTAATGITYSESNSKVIYTILTGNNFYNLPLNWNTSWNDSFQHFALTYRAGTGEMKAYHNGQMINSRSDVSGAIKAYKDLAALGSHWWQNGSASSTRLNADFDEVRVYDYALSDKEINDLSNHKCVPTDLDVSSPDEITLYPNPVNEKLFVNANSSGMLSFTDMQGRLVSNFALAPNQQEISLANLKSGLYILTITNDSGEIIHRDKLSVK